MTREEVRNFIKDGVDYLNKSIPFNSGRLTEFNSNRSNEYPYVWLESLSHTEDITTNSGPNVHNWGITLRIVVKDAIDSSPEQYEALIDQTDVIAQKLKKVYDQKLQSSKLVTMTGLTYDPVIKVHADCVTGTDLSFTLETYDNSKLC
jgi:hypothetical protein